MKLMISPEQHSDLKAIYRIHQLAFQQDNESKLIDKIRLSNSFIPELSLVAKLDDEPVGHILFSKIHIVGDKHYESLALAPMAVLPKYQNRGIGSAMVTSGIEKAKTMGYHSIIVLGHKDYYPKFGFEPASKWGIICPFEVPDEYFMALELLSDSLNHKQGKVFYPDVFHDV